MFHLFDLQNHASVYPMHARLALDVLPAAGATVGAECLFSRCKQVTTDRWSRLSPHVLEQIQCLEHNWHGTIVDYAALNDAQHEEIYMRDFEDIEEEEKLLGELSDSDIDFE